VTLWVATAVTWLWLVTAHLVRGSRAPERLAEQLRHPVQGPVAALMPIAGLLLAAQVLRLSLTAGRLLVIVFLVLAAAFAGWLLSHWATGGLRLDSVHGGYYLPTVAAGLIGGTASAKAGYHGVAVASFAIGVFFWVVVTTLLLVRIGNHGPLPAALQPTMAIIVAPPAVAGTAWFAISGDRIDTVQTALLGLTVLLMLMQIGLVSGYRRLHFNLGFWSFTFPFAAVGSYGVEWLHLTQAPWSSTWSWLLTAAVTVLIGAIAVFSVRGANTARSK
jgi:tellurite resistance protein